jgi:hypothetical protein
VPISAVDAIGPAFEHTKQQLLKPLRIDQWAKLALVGFLAGELSSSGFSFPSIPPIPHNTGDSQHLLGPFGGMSAPDWDPKAIAAVIALLVATALVLGIVFLYLNSVMRFVLFDSLIAKKCEIRKSWARRHRAGMRFFVWQILLGLASLGIMVVLIGIPALIAFSAGWITKPGDHVIPMVLGGLFVMLVFLVLVAGTLVVTVLTKDFVVPQMALEDISAIEGWRRLLPMMRSEKGGYAGYIGMKIVLALGAMVVFGIIATIVTIIMLIPTAAIGVAAVLAGKAAGLTWTPFTIAWGVVAVVIAFLIILYVVSFVSVPGIVFFPAFSLYFFAARYPALNAILNPAPPAPLSPAFLPPSEPIG